MRNLVKLYSLVPEETKIQGLVWYREAHNFCQTLSEQYGLSIRQTCAILSALSPATNFEQNKKDALNICARTKGYKCGTYGPNVEKARKIRDGQIEPDKAFSTLTGAKTYSFYFNILQPESPEHVTIDRHAYRIAKGCDYTSMTKNQYLEIVKAYTRAAKRIGILPCELQAVLWIDYRNKENIFFKKFDIVTPF